MIRHYVVAALRSMAAHRLLSSIAIVSLTIGIAATILMALVLRAALDFNGVVPDHGRIYLGISVLSAPGAAPDYNPASNARAAGLIAPNIAEIEATARLAEEAVTIGQGPAATKRTIYWADPGFFALLRLPVWRGDAVAALARPDGLVMTQAAARRLFGTANAIGRTIDVTGKPMTLRAIIADLPPFATDLEHDVFASGLSSDSALTKAAQDPPGGFSIGARTYLRLRAGASPQSVEPKMAPLVDGMIPAPMRGPYAMRLVRIDRLSLFEGFHPGARAQLVIGSLVAGLVLFIAVANYINLSVAFAGRRRREIGVRKAHGASRYQIATQFLGEAVLTTLIAACLAAAASEWLLAPLNAFLDSHAGFDYAREPLLLFWLVGFAMLLGLAAGAYPALLLSAFRPAATLRPGAAPSPSVGWLRNLLVVGQFAILIGLLIATAVIHRQRAYALHEALHVDIDNMLAATAPCDRGFVDEVGRLPGVSGVACSGAELLSGNTFTFVPIGGTLTRVDVISALPNLYALYGTKPLAGTLAGLPPQGETTMTRVVVNATAARRYGFLTPEDAIGKTVPTQPDARSRIVAVVPDFALTSVVNAIEPTIYLDRVQPPGGGALLSIKLAKDWKAGTLAAIDRAWRATGHATPLDRPFVSAHIEELYRPLARSTQLFGIFSGLAVLLAMLGLVGLSLSAADRRTKEIGIRKAMGADTRQILMLLLWQLARPVLWANLVAWPVAGWAMHRWLSGYAYHVALPPWLFPTAGLAALAIALVAIGGQTFRIARQKPVVALRYE